jgi:hypothetical protein
MMPDTSMLENENERFTISKKTPRRKTSDSKSNEMKREYCQVVK